MDRLSGWQPIATAPRDRENILVWWPDEFHCPIVAHYDTGKWSDAGIGWKWSGWGVSKTTEQTHWMPLPELPNKESDNG